MVEIRKYRDPQGRVPFDRWLDRLKDNRGAKRIQIRVERLMLGMTGDAKALGGGLHELRIPEGPGYRVYYGWDGDTVVILLCGGDKGSQQRDIALARQYWSDYRGQ